LHFNLKFLILKKMKFHYIIILLLSLIITSCVPYQKIVYLQGDISGSTNKQEDYHIKKNDILYIKINSSNENINKLFASKENTNNNITNVQNLFFNGYSVDNQGYIEMPVLKKLYVEGKTFKEVKQLIQQKLLEKQFKSLDDIFIKIKLAGVPYTIVGEVNTPKTGVLYKEQPNLFDVIGDAGDISPVGDRKTIVIVRTVNGQQTKKILDLTQAEIVNDPYFYIRPNDLIYVQPLKQKTWGTGTTLQQTISSTITALSLITTIILLSKYTD